MSVSRVRGTYNNRIRLHRVACITLKNTDGRMFRARLVNTLTLLKDYYQFSLAREGWRPCFGDIDSYFCLDQTGLYVGELNDKPIATQAAIKYADGYVHFGSHIVEKKYRKHGYGLKLVDAILANSAPIKNASGYVISELARKLEKSYGMISRWPVGIYDINISKALQALGANESDSCEVKCINEINMQELRDYDTDVFGYNRFGFLEKWLNTLGAHVRVAVNQQGSIVGYVAVRLAFLQDEGYKLGPLFCENIEVGKALLKAVFEDVRESGLSTSNSVVLDSPIGKNPEAKQLMQLVDGKYLGHNEFMTTNGLPKGRFNQWFAITSPVCG